MDLDSGSDSGQYVLIVGLIVASMFPDSSSHSDQYVSR